MKTRFSLLLAFGLTLTACGTSSSAFTPLPSGAEPPADCARADADHVIAISANNLRLSAPCMVAPAGVAFVVRFTNNETMPHNLTIYETPSKSRKIKEGETFSGPEVTKDYPIDALTAGDYYFDCTIHPADMNGTLYVR
ncbi:MAG: cupredoxin domain-containing protein [Chloroflexota bacterium]